MIIAWDGSAMASRAVASALPLLRAAKQVEVVSIVGEKDLSGDPRGTRDSLTGLVNGPLNGPFRPPFGARGGRTVTL